MVSDKLGYVRQILTVSDLRRTVRNWIEINPYFLFQYMSPNYIIG